MPEPRTYPEGVTSWVDVEVPDLDAAQAFYGGLFGWTVEQVAPGYAIAKLDGLDVAGIASGSATPAWNTYVAVDDADDAAARVRAHGGQVVAGPDAAGEAGRSVACADPAGVPFRLWQAGRRARCPGGERAGRLELQRPARHRSLGRQGVLRVGVRLGGRRPRVRDADPAPRVRRPPRRDDRPGHPRTPGRGVRPPGFADAIGWLAPVQPDEQPHWHVSFTVADRDATVADVERLGGTVVRRTDTGWTREALVRDPQGAVFTASQFTPPD